MLICAAGVTDMRFLSIPLTSALTHTHTQTVPHITHCPTHIFFLPRRPRIQLTAREQWKADEAAQVKLKGIQHVHLSAAVTIEH